MITVVTDFARTVKVFLSQERRADKESRSDGVI